MSTDNPASDTQRLCPAQHPDTAESCRFTHGHHGTQHRSAPGREWRQAVSVDFAAPLSPVAVPPVEAATPEAALAEVERALYLAKAERDFVTESIQSLMREFGDVVDERNAARAEVERLRALVPSSSQTSAAVLTWTEAAELVAADAKALEAKRTALAEREGAEEQRGQRYHASYEAVYAYIGTLAGGVPLDVVHRNAIIWRAVQAALDAIPATTGEPASFAPAAEPPTQLGASAVREFVPDWVLPPGDILAAEMQARRETVYSISDGAPFGVKLVEDVLAARAAVTEELARWLEQSWGTPAEFWLRLEALWQDHSADAVVAAREEGIRIGREAAAQAILAHADKIAPRDDPVKSTMRRHLRIGAQVAANPATREQVAAAIESLARPSIPIVCHLDEAGQSVVVADAP